ncbi:hypothetical protein ALC53_14276 [Atta colombica]|uniref:Uncharacterized protein n=1 Tax=Atta colombica TaxID=520822 RepID=A0A151HYJ8_9HYME|nr:hypothetical protein ALC53_14276 [Atta colombica]
MKLMHNIKLSEEDKIQLLINGISNLFLRSSAAMIDVQTIDDFLVKMFKIASTCGVITQKTSSLSTRKKKVKNPPITTGKNQVKSQASLKDLLVQILRRLYVPASQRDIGNQIASSRGASIIVVNETCSVVFVYGYCRMFR